MGEKGRKKKRKNFVRPSAERSLKFIANCYSGNRWLATSRSAAFCTAVVGSTHQSEAKHHNRTCVVTTMHGGATLPSSLPPINIQCGCRERRRDLSSLGRKRRFFFPPSLVSRMCEGGREERERERRQVSLSLGLSPFLYGQERRVRRM